MYRVVCPKYLNYDTPMTLTKKKGTAVNKSKQKILIFQHE
jgi:hypothetical protein